MSGRRDQIVYEAARLRRFGYDWHQSFDMAELIAVLADAGCCAVPIEDILPGRTNEHQS